MLVVTRYRVEPVEADGFLTQARTALDVLAARPGFHSGRVGRAVDDPAWWTIVTEWEHVGAYRRALSSYEVKVHAVPLLSLALDEPSAYEVLEAVGGDALARTDRGTDRAADADIVSLGTAAAAAVPTDLARPRTRPDTGSV